MASIRRTLSPVPQHGSLMNGEACQVASPLSKFSPNSPNYPPNGSLNPVLGLFSHRSSRPFDRSKVKGPVWRRAFLHFLICFLAGFFLGLTPFVNVSTNVTSKPQDFNFEILQPVTRNFTSEPNGAAILETKGDFQENTLTNNSFDQDSNRVLQKLLIIVTPTHSRPLQAYFLNRLAHTLKLVPNPLLWIVVEMNSQSSEIADLLRNTGVMHRHLVCNFKNSTNVSDSSVRLRNVALSHIEKHHLDAIVYFADDNHVYSTDLFDKMRQISRFGTWPVAKLVESKGEVFLEGPICNISQVIGWHIADVTKRFRRFHAEMSGFAFNSSIIWDSKRWHRPTLEPIRQLETLKEGFQASTFIEQIVEDESQMECLSSEISGIMVWHHAMDSESYDPHHSFSMNSFGAIFPLA